MNGSTIKSVIESGKELKLTGNDLHFKHVFKNTKNEKVIVIMNAIFEKYYNLMLDHAITVTLTDEDYFKYRFKPRVMSTDLYGTPELHFLLLRLNHMVSVTQFDVKELRVFSPEIVKILNEITIHEYDNYVDNEVAIIKKLQE